MVLHILLKHIAAFVFNTFSFALLQMLYIVACWAPIIFILCVHLFLQMNNKNKNARYVHKNKNQWQCFVAASYKLDAMFCHHRQNENKSCNMYGRAIPLLPLQKN